MDTLLTALLVVVIFALCGAAVGAFFGAMGWTFCLFVSC